MNTITVKIISLILSLFILLSVGYQIFLYLYSPIKTETALEYSTTKTIPFKGIYVRNEKVIEYNGSGIISFAHEDGAKIAKNSIIANVYNNESDIQLEKKIAAVKNKISILEESQLAIGTDISQLENFNDQIDEKHTLLLQALNDGNFLESGDLRDDLLCLFNKFQIITDKTDDFSDKINDLKEQISIMNNQISSSPTKIFSTDSGYFVNFTDGYEDLLNFNAIADLTEEDIKKIIKLPNISTNNNKIGKLLEDYTWKLVGILESDTTIGMTIGSTVTLLIGDNERSLKAVVETVEKLDENKNKIVFSCDVYTGELKGRAIQAKVIINDYTGIRISRECIRFNENNEIGVYTLIGSQVSFKKISILYWGDDFVIVKNDNKTDSVSLYDKVIKQGKDLIDGKVL